MLLKQYKTKLEHCFCQYLRHPTHPLDHVTIAIALWVKFSKNVCLQKSPAGGVAWFQYLTHALKGNPKIRPGCEDFT